MKKALSAVLALLMILSCMVFPTVAAEATTTIKDKVVLSNCDSGNGWNNFQTSNRGSTIDRENFTEGTGSYSQTMKGSGLQSGYFEFMWKAANLTGGAEQNALDVSKMAYLVFDVYLSDVSMAKTSGQIELANADWTDNKELHVTEALSTYFVEPAKAGWNTVKIDLNTFGKSGTVDLTKIAFFRMYRQKGSASYSNDNTEYTMKIDNVRFLPRYEADNGFDIVLSQGEKWVSDGGADVPFTLKEYEGRGQIPTGTYTGSLNVNKINALLHLDKEPRDVSGAQNLAFWMYVSDPSLLAGKLWQIELDSYSGSGVDYSEIRYGGVTLETMKGSAVVAGWNYFFIPLTKFSAPAADDPKTSYSETYDATQLYDVRIRMTETVDLGAETLTWALATVGFTNTAYVEPEEPVDPDAPVIPESAKPTLISITDCDTTANFNKVTTNLVTVDTVDPSQGKASLATTIQGVKTATSTIQYEWMNKNNPVDASLIQQLSFDLYVSDPAAFAETRFELELSGNYDGNGNHDDGNEYVKQGTLADLKGDALVAGWNTFSIPLNALTKNGNPDMTNFSWFRLFMNQSTVGIEGETTVIKLDNVYLTADPVVYEDRIPLPITWVNGNASAGKLTPNAGTDSYHVDLNAYVKNPVDISKMTWFEFDVYLGDASLNNNRFRIDFTSSGTCDKSQITASGSLAELTGTTIPAGEWTHVRIPFFAFQSANSTDGAFNPAKANFFRFFNVGGNGSTDGTSYDFKVKNFAITKDTTTTETEFYIWDAESTAQFAGGTAGAVSYSNGHALSDVDGDGDLEYVLRNFAATDETKLMGPGNQQIVLRFNPTAKGLGYIDMKALRFDLYVSNERFLDVNMTVEFTSSGACDQGEITSVLKLRNYIVEDKGNGWYTIEIKNSALTTNSPGSSTPFMPVRFNYMRWYLASDLTWEANEDMIVAVDDFYLLRENASTTEGPTAIPEGAIPFTSSKLAIVDLNAGNNYLHGATSRALATRITPDVLDASVYNLFCGNLYIENIEELYDEMFCFEITSAGQCDKEESSINNAPLMAMFTRFDGQPLQNGYNYVYIDVYSELFNSHACDLTQADYVRIFNQSPVRATKNTVVTLSDLHFANENVLNVELAKNMKIEGATLTLNDNVSLNIIANIHPAMSDYTATLTIDGVIYEVEGTRIGTTNQVLFTTPEFQENELAKTFTFALVGKTADGKVISDELANYSVKQYCVDTLAAINNGVIYDTDGGEYSAMLTDLLLYAAAVEKLCGQTELVTDGVDLSKASTFAPLTVYNYLISGEQGNCPAAFEDIVEINLDPLSDNINGIVTFKADSVEGLKVKVAVGSGEPIYITEFEDNGDGTYSFTIDMRVFEVNAAYTCTFDGYKDYSLVLSVGSSLMMIRNECLDELAEDPTNEVAQAVLELLEAIACYANSVYNYVACQQ